MHKFSVTQKHINNLLGACKRLEMAACANLFKLRVKNFVQKIPLSKA